MGQTLTHGVYLPDEGERNCYSGLAANWQILDTSVGTIAEHTAALSGKAPLVHTHSKANITDFPAYGTTAGTICEGNDSRLSDARTPVAHTHTKSDVTDLLNSNFIPSANNSYDLGSSSNQWQSVYAQSYYYGTTSFTNKFVTTDTNQNITSVKTFIAPQYSKSAFRFINDGYTSGTPLTDLFYQSLSWGGYVNNVWTASFSINNAIRANGYSDTSFRTFSQASNTLTGFVLETNADASDISFKPIATGTHNLGTSSYKWKTLNGINPGALSIFNPSATQDPIDVPSTWVTDGSAWNTLNVSNMGDGWICLTYRLCGTNDYILARFGGINANTHPSMIFHATRLQDSKCYIYLLMPVTKAMGNIYLEIKLDSNAVLVKHSFIPAYGTV